MGIKKVILICVIVSFLHACTNSSAPTKQEIIGTWISEQGAVLKFEADGSFIGENLPPEIINETSLENFDASGKWSIEASRKSWDQQPWHVSLSFTDTPTDYISATSLIISGSNLMENAPPWRNLFFWVDEEGGERYEFKKK